MTNRSLSERETYLQYSIYLMSREERESSNPIPLTRKQAISHIEKYYSAAHCVCMYEKCEQLVKFIEQCRIALTPADAAKHIAGRSVGIGRAIQALYTISDHSGFHTLSRKSVAEEAQRQEDLSKAAEHLKSAAKLIGIREDFFYSIQLHGQPDLTHYVSEEPPEIHGESAIERNARKRLNKALRGYNIDVRARYYKSTYIPFDAARGKASAEARAIKLLWDVFPDQLKKPAEGWEPYACVAGIARFCGLEVDARYARKTVIP